MKVGSGKGAAGLTGRLTVGEMIMTKPLKPGQTAPRSGQYTEVGPRGGQPGREVTVPAGRPLPPTTTPNKGYVLTDPTKNKSGQGK